MVRILAHCTCGQPLLFMLRMTVTITITMTGLEAVRILDERGTRKHPNGELQRIDHKKRTSLPIQYDFPYRYVFPANHPYSSYAQFLGLPAAATPQYAGGAAAGGGGGGSPSYDLYAPVPPFAPSLYQHQHMHQHQHQLQLQQPLPQPPQVPLPLPPQNAQPEFKYTLKPGASAGAHHQQHVASASPNNAHMGPFQSGSAAPTILLLHATNPAAGSVQTFLLIPASSNDGGQSFGVGPSVSPNFLNAIAAGAFPLRGGSGAGAAGSGTLPAAAQMSMPGSSAAAHPAAPMMMRPLGADHAKMPNGHFLNQLSAAQLMSRPASGGLYQLPLMPSNGKYYKRKKSSIEAKMSQADGGHALQSSGDRPSTSTEGAATQIRNGHAPRMPDSDETGTDNAFDDYASDGGPLAPSKRS